MGKFSWGSSVVVLCLHCGGQGQTAPPAEEPAVPTEEPAMPDAEEAAPDEPGGATEEVTPAEESTPSGEAAPPKESSSKPKCAELKRTKCMITKGCAWNDVRRCIEDEGGP